MTEDAGNWVRTLSQRWAKEPVVLPAVPPIDLARAFGVAVEAAEPFRAGTRFRSLPAVGMRDATGSLKAPGDLLPDEHDRDAAAYQDRMAERLPGGWVLTVQEPLVQDFDLWSTVRDAIAPLWAAVGRPALAVATMLIAGDRYTDPFPPPAPPTHVPVGWVLDGTLRVELEPAIGYPDQAPGVRPGTTTLTARAGELVHWPAGMRATTTVDRCMVLWLRVPWTGELATMAVKDVVIDLVQATREGDAVPYLGYLPSAAPPEPAIAAVASTTAEVVEGDALDRALRVRWARRWSAESLEPVPLPRSEPDLGGRHRVRRSAAVQRTPDGQDKHLWTANGYGFTVGGRDGDAVLELLPLGQQVEVDELCRAVGVGDAGQTGAAPVLSLLRTLYRLHAIDVVDEDGRIVTDTAEGGTG